MQLLDYEIELGLVLKRDLTRPAPVTPDDLHEVLAGVTIVNDCRARDVQLPQVQFYKGKSYRSFGPVGPVLLLLDAAEWTRWPELRMRSRSTARCARRRCAATCCSRRTRRSPSSRAAGPARRRPDRHRHAGRLRGAAPGKLVCFVMRHLCRDGDEVEAVHQKGLANPLYLQPGDRMTPRSAPTTARIDLGEQRNRIVAD